MFKVFWVPHFSIWDHVATQAPWPSLIPQVQTLHGSDLSYVVVGMVFVGNVEFWRHDKAQASLCQPLSRVQVNSLKLFSAHSHRWACRQSLVSSLECIICPLINLLGTPYHLRLDTIPPLMSLSNLSCNNNFSFLELRALMFYQWHSLDT